MFPRSTINVCFHKTDLERVRRYDLLFALGCALLLTAAASFLSPQSETSPVDQYRLMAQNPFQFRAFPYGMRVATPVVTGLLWNDVDWGFRCIAVGSYFLCGTLFVLWMRLSGVSLGWILALLPAFYFASTARFILANPWYVDPMNYWLLIALFAASMTGNFGITMAALSLSALNRPESLSFLVVLAIIWFRKDRPLQSLGAVLLCAAPALAVVSSVRFLWPLVSDCQVWQEIAGGNFKINPQNYAAIFEQQGFKQLINPLVYREALPCLWGTATIGFLQTKSRIRWMALAQIALAVLPMIVATDYFRLPFYVFPVLLFLSGLGLHALARIHAALAGSAVLAIWLLTALAPNSLTGGIIVGALLLSAYIKFHKKSVDVPL